MGLGDLRARLLLFFARKLREWANSIEGKVPSPPPQPPGSEPSHPFTRVSGGPPQHWIDLVRERAPELLSLTREYPSTEVPLPENHVHAHRSEIDDRVEAPDQKRVNVPAGKENVAREPGSVKVSTGKEDVGKEDVARKPGPVPLPPPKVVDRHGARRLTRVKSSLPRPKPLTLKPLNELSPYLQRPPARDQVTESAKPSQLIEVFSPDKRTVTSSNQSDLGAVAKKNQAATRDPAGQPQARKSDKTPAKYESTNKPSPIIPTAQADELNVTRKSEVQRPVFNVIKPQSGPRRYLQAILNVTRKILRRTASGEVQSTRAITAVNVLVNSSSENSSSTHDVVRPANAPKTVTRRSKMKSEPFTLVSARPTNLQWHPSEPIAFQQPRALETATRQASPPTRQASPPTRQASPPTRQASPPTRQASPPTRLPQKVPMENVKTASRPPATVAFPRAVNRLANAPNAHFQDAVVNMPALMDEENMSRASSMHLANLHPGKNQWPDLPSAPSTEIADDLMAQEQNRDRIRRLEQEQRGTPWNV